MKVLLSVGHSILKSGSCTSADGRPYGGVLEYAYNKAIVHQTAEYLRKVGHEVDVLICPELQFTRSTEERTYKLAKERAGNYDLAAELHLNSSKYHNARGCEVLYLSQKGKEFADRIQAQLTTVFEDHGNDKRDNLYMLTQTEAPAVIIESFFCDNAADCALAEETDVALLIAQGIHGRAIEPDVQQEQTNGFLYRVQTGAFRNKSNAEKLKTELVNLGFDAMIKTVDLDGTLYRVQVGAFGKKANAVNMQKKLQAAGYECFIV